jgi:sulfur-carrier protein
VNIQVLFFSSVADCTKMPGTAVVGVADVQQLLTKLKMDYPGLEKEQFTVAVNREITHKNTPLRDGDEVALLPPFSGG